MKFRRSMGQNHDLRGKPALRGKRVDYVLVALVVIASVWSTLWIAAPRQQTLDERVQGVASQLKCLICEGESVADSQSTLAKQMRAAIREQLQSGRSEQDVIHYFEQRYGAQIVWSPPWQGFSLLVWLVPIAFLLYGIGVVIHLLREWCTTTDNSEKGILEKEQVQDTVPTIGRDFVRTERESLNDGLERYRAQLETELAADDVLFRKNGKPLTKRTIYGTKMHE